MHPSAGSPFAIGETTVACTATDAGANTANASFVVTVLGANAQLANLIHKVIDATNLPAATKAQLTASLQSLAAGFDPSSRPNVPSPASHCGPSPLSSDTSPRPRKPPNGPPTRTASGAVLAC